MTGQRADRRRRRPARAPERPSAGAFALDGTLATSAALLVGLGIVMNYSTTAALAIGEALPPLALRHWISRGAEYDDNTRVGDFLPKAELILGKNL